MLISNKEPTLTTLSGEKIQNLLWEEGLDFDYVTTEEGYQSIHINCGSQAVRLEHLWADEDDWIMDIGDVVLSHINNGNVIAVFHSSSSTEEELVAELQEHYEKLI